MSRSSRRRRGRPYQPLPAQRNPWPVRLAVAAIGIILLFGTLALFAGPQ